jgi:hypothetical protein
MEEQKVESRSRAPGIAASPTEESVYLLGSPPIREFMDFVRARAAKGTCAPEDLLVEQWRKAARHLRELETTEAGFAGDGVVMPLPASMQVLADLELQDPCVQRSLRLLPHRWALVDLDQLIVHQRSLVLPYVAECAAALPGNPTDEELFHLAAGHLKTRPEVRVTRTSENVYTFASPSSDLRFLDVALLDPQAVHDYDAPGRVVGIVGVAVGFGANHVSALRMQGRLILCNGTHRSFMQFDRGIRRVPCLVRDVSCEDELDLIGASDIRQNLHLYLRSPRPPRLKDFSNPQLRKIIPGVTASRLVHVQINTQRSRVTIA